MAFCMLFYITKYVPKFVVQNCSNSEFHTPEPKHTASPFLGIKD